MRAHASYVSTLNISSAGYVHARSLNIIITTNSLHYRVDRAQEIIKAMTSFPMDFEQFKEVTQGYYVQGLDLSELTTIRRFFISIDTNYDGFIMKHEFANNLADALDRLERDAKHKLYQMEQEMAKTSTTTPGPNAQRGVGRMMTETMNADDQDQEGAER